MYSVAVTKGPTEFLVRDRLVLEGLQVFCPYTRVKEQVKVIVPRTKANPRPRAMYKATWRDVPQWPRYLFFKLQNEATVNTVLNTRDVSYVVRSSEGSPAILADEAMNEVRRNCDADGRVLSHHRFSVGDLLRFVMSSTLASRRARVLSIEDSGLLRVEVDGRLRATVHHSELALAS